MLTWHPITQLPPPPTPHYNPPPSLSSIHLYQPRSCSAIRLQSRWYWGWCRYLRGEQLVKFATHTHTLARSHEHTLFNLISHFVPFSLFPSLEFVVSSLCHGVVPQLPALNTLQLFPHDMDLIWNDGPRPTNILFYSKSCMDLFLLGTIHQLESNEINKIFSGWGILLAIWRQLD